MRRVEEKGALDTKTKELISVALAVATQYGIMSIPTLLVFKDGELVDRIVGAMPKRMLEAEKRRNL